MQKIKDILYDTNDLIVALFIIGIAALLIWDRIGVILDYPSANASGAVYEEIGLVGEEEAEAPAGADADANGDGADATDDGADADAIANAGGADFDAETNDAAAGETPEPPADEPVKHSLYIAYGETAAQIAQKLLDAGLIESNNEFYDALFAADAATRLQAGSFIIAEGATLTEIVDILTGR
ncbi:MAG: endolytic transglycosylase MltG [Clostridiales Family XIII bacterium]|jgi:hypothetical protein|nr:endolytic transglycosylase MltG [Clostridiales Family XIII bacterium]